MHIQQILGNIVIAIGVIFMGFGIFGIFKFKDFYPRILVASKVDVVGGTTIILGLVIRNGFSFFSGKLLLILIILLVLSPLVAHIVVKSAFQSGYQIEGKLSENENDEDLL